MDLTNQTNLLALVAEFRRQGSVGTVTNTMRAAR
jgi:hypothetical protein